MRERILVLEQDDKQRDSDSLCDWLAFRGCVVRTASDIPEASDLIAQGAVDVAVVDAALLRDGVRLGEIGRRDPDMQVVVRNAAPGSAEELLAQGAFAVVDDAMGIAAIGRVIDLAAEHGRLRRDQAIIRAAFDGTKDGISVIDADLTILRANSTMEQWYAHHSPLVGEKCYKVYHDRTEPCESCPAARAIATGLPQVEIVPLAGPDGADGLLQLHAMPFHDATGRVAGVVEHVTDVTERRQNEERLQHIARMGAVGQMAGGVAHEFNNIMASIMGYAQLAMQTGEGEDVRRALSVAAEGCKRGKHITDGMLAFANPGEPRRSRARIEQAVDSALALLMLELDHAHIDVVRGDASAIPDLIVDEHLMEQVFVSLFMNACQAMPDGGRLSVSFSVSACNACGRSQRCHIDVTDTGVGMTPSEVERVFDPFFTTKGRLGNSEVPGLGLGLSITHGAVMAHSGEIHLSSKPGRGTTITVCLPLIEGESGTIGSEVSPLEEQPVSSPGPRSLRILIAEDEDPLRDLLCELLRRQGHEVTPASDGLQALRALQSGSFDLIITDILMPKANGTELLKHVRDERLNIACIVVSGRGEDILQKQAMALGASVCLRKPFEIDELFAAVAKATAPTAADS